MAGTGTNLHKIRKMSVYYFEALRSAVSILPHRVSSLLD